MDPAPIDTTAEANRLYWHTEQPVGDIAARLDLSRRALYEAIRPVPAEGQCGSCGAPLEFIKRSSRMHGLATCSSCGRQASAPAVHRRDNQPWTWSPPSRTAPPSPPMGEPVGVWTLGAAALAGAMLAAGATLVLIRPRLR